MRRWLNAALILAFLLPTANARAAQDCRSDRNPICVEWLDQGGPHRARLVIRDDRWTWFDTHSGGGIHCGTCADEGIAAGLLHFGLLDPAGFGLPIPNSIDGALEPEMVSLNVWAVLDGKTRYQYKAEGTPFPISIWGMKGKGRVLTIYREGRPGHVLAIAAGNELLSVFGAFSSNDGRELLTNDVGALASAIALEIDLPSPNSPLWKSPEPPPPEFHVGDLRRLLQGKQP